MQRPRRLPHGSGNLPRDEGRKPQGLRPLLFAQRPRCRLSRQWRGHPLRWRPALSRVPTKKTANIRASAKRMNRRSAPLKALEKTRSAMVLLARKVQQRHASPRAGENPEAMPRRADAFSFNLFRQAPSNTR